MPSKTPPSSPGSSFRPLAEAHLKNSLFTAVYAECGSLNKAAPEIVFEHLPDGRDLFDLASLTKPLVTAPLMVWTAKKKGLDLSAPLSTWSKMPLGWLSDRRITVEQVLMHRSGLPAWRNFYVRCSTPNDSVETPLPSKLTRVIDSYCPDLVSDPTDCYSDVGYILLGYILQEIWGITLDKLWSKYHQDIGIDRERIANLGYCPSHSLRSRCIPTGQCAVRGRQLIGEVHDENAWALGGIAGHAGLFGSGKALGNFLRDFANTPFGKQYLALRWPLAGSSPTPPQAPPGFRVWSEESGRDFGNQWAIGHWGFTGTGFWIDPADLSYGILLTNRVISGRLPTPAMKAFRQQAFGYFAAALGKT